MFKHTQMVTRSVTFIFTRYARLSWNFVSCQEEVEKFSLLLIFILMISFCPNEEMVLVRELNRRTRITNTNTLLGDLHIDKVSGQSYLISLNLFSVNLTKWSNTLRPKPTNYLSMFDHFVGLTVKGLNQTDLLYCY